MPPNAERSHATTSAILAAATTILREEGVQALTMQRVARAAGVSKGALTQVLSS